MFARGKWKKSDRKENCHILNKDLFVEFVGECTDRARSIVIIDIFINESNRLKYLTIRKTLLTIFALRYVCTVYRDL